jgi:hypothetical protein
MLIRPIAARVGDELEKPPTKLPSSSASRRRAFLKLRLWFKQSKEGFQGEQLAVAK